jgi:ElaB/YqjD/DUF883 family membrane-anchored ribosome-binding protein
MEEFKAQENVSGIKELKNLFNHVITEDELKRQIGEAKTKLKAEIQNKPLAAVGIAVAVGFVLGVLLKR